MRIAHRGYLMGLINIFGKKPEMQVLDFLIVHKHWDYSLKDISDATGVSFRTLQRLVPKMIDAGVLLRTRKEGKAQMFILNSGSPSVKKLGELALAADVEYAEKVAGKTKAHKKAQVSPRRPQAPEFVRCMLPVPGY